jgi:hypothetical protein
MVCGLFWELAGHNLVVEIGVSFTIRLNTISACTSGNSVQVTALFIEVLISIGE